MVSYPATTVLRCTRDIPPCNCGKRAYAPVAILGFCAVEERPKLLLI